MAKKTGRTIKGLDPEARRRQRKEELLESALDLFASNGYANTSIEQICQHATVGYKAFYDEFATKEQLFIELYDAIGGRLLPAVLEAIAEPVPGDELLPLMISSYIRAALADPRAARVLFLTSAGVSEAVDLHRRRAHRAFAQIFQDMYGAGMISETNTARSKHGFALALGATGGMGEIVTDYLIDPGKRTAEDLIEELGAFIETILAGLRQQPPTTGKRRASGTTANPKRRAR
jgi:AcrR family transcriptional regulator